VPLSIIAVVLVAALLHATWNAAVKSGRDKFLDATVIAVGAGIAAALVLPFLPLPDRASWPFILISSVIHVAYYSLLAAAYRTGDLSVAYPLMRGTAPLVVTLASGLVLAEPLTGKAYLGVLLISCGIFGLMLSSPRRGALAPAAFALVNALVIACYTMVDGTGVRLSGNAATYTCWLTLLTPILLVAINLGRGPSEFAAHVRQRWLVGLLGGSLSLAAYSLSLWAMTRAPIALVAALRETSILFGVVIAASILKERFGVPRYAAALLVVAGVGALRFA
jgi:drug/metabolite transporter (DMT)-like permease